eukprot:SAG11_NODE_191_length_12943_cov_3.853706_1_plen_31_part_10
MRPAGQSRHMSRTVAPSGEYRPASHSIQASY